MEADFVIVGGGSAGCVLANRLSADGRHVVVLIEAGPPDKSPFIHMPAGIIPVIRSDTYNWKYWTAPEPQMGNRPMHWPRGRTLGGSSSINAMCYIRGHAWDYDHWAELGCKGWGYADVLPVFRRMENFEPAKGAPDEYHGVGGPLNVAAHRYLNPLMKAFVDAAQQAGYPLTPDFNGGTQEGIGYYDVMQKDGQRCSNAKAYLDEQVKARDNLTILTDAHVQGVRFEGKRAVGVTLKGAPGEIRARREVILSAGAIGSPQLLMLSGIGSAAHLGELGVPVVCDSAGVGENLQDHLDVTVTVKERSRHAVSLNPVGLPRSLKALWQYATKKEGEMTSNLAQAGGFIKSNPREPIPDIQLHFVPFAYTNHGQDLKPLTGWGYTLMACDLRPKSRGRISLASTDALVHPKIEARYLQHESEMQRLLTAVMKAREILAQPAFKPHRGEEVLPGAEIRSDEELREWIRQKAETIYHPVGTCKMGVDDAAVLDLQLKVRGVEGLRVVDASVMPTLIGGNTNAPTTMIAERGAEMILTDYR